MGQKWKGHYQNFQQKGEVKRMEYDFEKDFKEFEERMLQRMEAMLALGYTNWDKLLKRCAENSRPFQEYIKAKQAEVESKEAVTV